ncbi:hypothetical protein [Gracilibacillus sp. YIM 98692]|uniref:hypothetical protein n=1 Tax=Gracilibacillus sp. YIM 98692 TaxID=2663532 RepID=UPI0013CFDAFF|nr:hypothetical protein [Gracilibacillus sp. YIM 98692]
MKKLALLSLVFLFLVSACGENVEPKENEQSGTNENEEESTPTGNQIPEMTESDALALMESYKETVVSLFKESAEDHKIESFQSKEEVTQHFQTVMSADLAEWMTDTYFEEKEDGLYVIPKDGPTWLDTEKAFTVETVSDKHVKIIQERNNELVGHGIFTYHAKYLDEKWIVDEIEYEEVSEQTDKKDTQLTSTAENVLDAIARQDFQNLANYVHPEKGVLFSPYVHVTEDAVVFEQEEVASFFENNKVYTWGIYDGSGKVIEFTPSEYYEEFIYDKNYLEEADEVLINERKQRGNMVNNIDEVFPDADVVEFHIPPEESGGMDWASLNLVFEKMDSNEWKLVAIVHDQWTI